MDKEYNYQANWNSEEEAWIATVDEFPSLSWIEETKIEALQGLIVLVDAVVVDLRKNNMYIPQPK